MQKEGRSHDNTLYQVSVNIMPREQLRWHLILYLSSQSLIEKLKGWVGTQLLNQINFTPLLKVTLKWGRTWIHQNNSLLLLGIFSPGNQNSVLLFFCLKEATFGCERYLLSKVLIVLGFFYCFLSFTCANSDFHWPRLTFHVNSF